MVGCKSRERCTHRIASYVSWTEAGWLTAGKQIGNGDEVAAIGLHRVRRGLTCLPVIQELLEPLGDLIDGRRDGSSFNNAFGDGVAGIGRVRHTVSLADKRWIINVIHIIG